MNEYDYSKTIDIVDSYNYAKAVVFVGRSLQEICIFGIITIIIVCLLFQIGRIKRDFSECRNSNKIKPLDKKHPKKQSKKRTWLPE
ncbi:hypothetical protein [Photobacterium kishitanii]|uniref:Uncharacterized protein n=1 Tax=Photobacterium kishitanii TaxID=318456 RepID=A0A2T3KL00_9GAMM|nr:hypothetical protein [Photobacterium kishitanii]PSV00333.1 hypothetical protein C9J27_04195 [Photobacterium kishitanii]